MKNIASKLNSFTKLELEESIDLSDLLGQQGERYLNRYSADEMFALMKQVGMIEHLSRRGFKDLNILISADEARVHYLKLYSGKPAPENMLMDLRVTETRFIPKKSFFPEDAFIPAYDMVVIEWLSLQNSQKDDFDKPQLPGQTRPGLGILSYCFELMYAVARQISKDGFLDIPDHLHGAIMYSKKFKFFDPQNEAFIRAVLRDLKDYSMSDLSWGTLTNTIINENTGQPEEYRPSEQIYYASERMKNYFTSDIYKAVFKREFKRKKYRFDHETMVKRRADILKTKRISDL